MAVNQNEKIRIGEIKKNSPDRRHISHNQGFRALNGPFKMGYPQTFGLKIPRR